MNGNFAPKDTKNLGFEDMLKYGFFRFIDSELANPPLPSPMNSEPESDTIVQTTPTGFGVVSKEAGKVTMTDQLGMNAGTLILVGGIALLTVVLVKAL